MKKIIILLAGLMLFNISFTAEINSKNTVFTFEGFLPTSADVVRPQIKNIDLSGSKISYPVFIGNEEITKNINDSIEKFIHKFKGTKEKTNIVSYNITGSNDLFVSVLFNITETDGNTYNDAITFNVRNGKIITLKDLFINGYNGALNSAISDRVKQFGLTTIDTKKYKFNGITKNQKFYLEDDAIVLFYNQGEGTEFGDGQLFIPFLIENLIGIIK